MITLKERIDLLVELGEYLQGGIDDQGNEVLQKTYQQNQWFTKENTEHALKAISGQFLSRERLEGWLKAYPGVGNSQESKTVGLIMAGNIPLVGFHDWLCVFVSGNRARIKLSDKDKFLLPWLVAKLGEWEKESFDQTYFLSEGEKLGDVDAVVATGSNNSARYFQEYFGKYPNIIRKNRNGIAILTGEETEEDRMALGRDIFSYFGLGCRNVSKLYVPEDYDFKPLLDSLHKYQDILHHNKYKNNYDYNFTLYLLNKMEHHTSGCLLMREDQDIPSRIACVHYSHYSNSDELTRDLQKRKDEIQVVVGNKPVDGLSSVGFGQSQSPGLGDYADGVDVMEFLLQLKS